MTRPLIAQNLFKAYGSSPVIDDASLSLLPGQITALIGRSGAGKTTLLRLLAGMERPDRGTIQIGEKVLSSPHQFLPPEQRRIGLIFQDFALFPHLDVSRNIAFGLGHLGKPEQQLRTGEWIERLNLESRASAMPHQLSGGEQQRVAIARALAPGPLAILMDEPFSGLDPVLREQTREAALAIIASTQIPTLMVTHDAAEAMGYADRVIILHAGRVLQEGPSAHLYDHPINLAAASALGALQSLDRASLPDAWQAVLPNACTLHLRPEALYLDLHSGVRLEVISARRLGTLSRIVLRCGTDEIAALMILNTLPAPGDTLPVSINPASVLVF